LNNLRQISTSLNTIAIDNGSISGYSLNYTFSGNNMTVCINTVLSFHFYISFSINIATNVNGALIGNNYYRTCIRCNIITVNKITIVDMNINISIIGFNGTGVNNMSGNSIFHSNTAINRLDIANNEDITLVSAHINILLTCNISINVDITVSIIVCCCNFNIPATTYISILRGNSGHTNNYFTCITIDSCISTGVYCSIDAHNTISTGNSSVLSCIHSTFARSIRNFYITTTCSYASATGLRGNNTCIGNTCLSLWQSSVFVA